MNSGSFISQFQHQKKIECNISPQCLLDGFFKKNPSFKIAMSGQMGGQEIGCLASGIVRGLPFG